MSDFFEEIKRNIIAGKVDQEDEGFDGDLAGKPGVIELVNQAVDENVSPTEILNKALTPGMEEVGRKYEEGEYTIADMLASAECVSEATNILKPLLLKEDVQSKGKFIMATVEGDLHDIGKNIVATILQGSGYEVEDLGTSVKADKIVNKLKETNANFVGLSALLTTTMERMGEVIELMKKEGVRDQATVCIGGAPTSEDFAKKIGADVYAKDAFDALGKLEKTAG